jgi:DNA-binding NarL/FixJ family response regulator
MRRKALDLMETSVGPNSQNSEGSGLTSEAPASATIGLILAGHHPLTLCGLSQIFERESDCGVLATCTDADATLKALRWHQPEILILDLDLPRKGAFTVLRRIQRERLFTRVVLLAAASDDDEVVEAVRLGARAVVLKEMPPEAFVTCVRKIHGGEQWLEGHTAGRLVSKLFKGGTPIRHAHRQLTPREAEIARLAVRGVSTREIAVSLAVKQGTVKIHLHHIYGKLNVGGRLGLILFTRRQDLM